jgi:hypothetical protein
MKALPGSPLVITREDSIKKKKSLKNEMQLKRINEKQEKQESLMRDNDKLNKEKEKIVEFFKMEKEKPSGRKCNKSRNARQID